MPHKEKVRGICALSFSVLLIWKLSKYIKSSIRSVQEWIVFAFEPDRRVRPVPACYNKIVLERQHVFGYRVDELSVITAWQVRTADRPAKKTVAGKDRPHVVFDEHDMSGRMAWTMPDLELQIPDIK